MDTKKEKEKYLRSHKQHIISKVKLQMPPLLTICSNLINQCQYTDHYPYKDQIFLQSCDSIYKLSEQWL